METQQWFHVGLIAVIKNIFIIYISLLAGTSGSLSVWDLKERRLIGVMEAHPTNIAGVSFLHGQQLLVTNGSDNSVKMWAFDQNDGLGRELRMRLVQYTA